MTKSVTLCQMNLQEEYYGSSNKEELKVDTSKTIQTYLNFFSTSKVFIRQG